MPLWTRSYPCQDEVQGTKSMFSDVRVSGQLVPWLFRSKCIHVIGREVRIGKNCARGLEYGPRPQAKGSRVPAAHPTQKLLKYPPPQGKSVVSKQSSVKHESIPIIPISTISNLIQITHLCFILKSPVIIMQWYRSFLPKFCFHYWQLH